MPCSSRSMSGSMAQAPRMRSRKVMVLLPCMRRGRAAEVAVDVVHRALQLFDVALDLGQGVFEANVLLARALDHRCGLRFDERHALVECAVGREAGDQEADEGEHVAEVDGGVEGHAATVVGFDQGSEIAAAHGALSSLVGVASGSVRSAGCGPGWGAAAPALGVGAMPALFRRSCSISFCV